MFDYQYGTGTKKFKHQIKDMLPRLHIGQSAESKGITFVMHFLTGFEVLEYSLVCKKWYAASWDTTLWRVICQSHINETQIEELYPSCDAKVKTFEISVQKRIGDTDTFQKLANCIRWKLVFIVSVYKFCSKCQSSEGKLRFCPILKKTLCASCAKLPEYSMISLENAECEYGVTKEEIEAKQLDGLRVPHTNFSGKFMFVYYVSDIISLLKQKNITKIKPLQARSTIEERKRTEIVWYLRELQVPFDFIETYLSSEGTLAHNYMMGRSRMTADKVAKALAKIYHCEKRKEGEKSEKFQEKIEDKPTVKKAKLSEDEKVLRKMQLIERLTLMGLDTERINFDDKSSIVYSYITGRTSKDLGIVAGAVWREFKPIFTGITSSTTQRIKDL